MAVHSSASNFKRIPFKIRIRDFNGYTMHVEVVDCPFGRMREPEIVPFLPELIPYLSKMGNPTSRGTMDLSEQMLMGQLIADMLFPTQVRSLFLQTAKYEFRPLEDVGIRILLELDAEQLTAIPWEYCYLHEWKFLRERVMMDYVQNKTLLAASPTWNSDEKASVRRFLDRTPSEIRQAGFMPFYNENEAREGEVHELDWEVLGDDVIREKFRQKIKKIQEFRDDFRRGFLGLDSHLSIIRYEPYFDQVLSGPPLNPSDIQPVDEDSELKIFLCAADPLDLGKIDVEGEVNIIANTIRGEHSSILGRDDERNTAKVVIDADHEEAKIKIVPSPKTKMIRTRRDLEKQRDILNSSDIFHFTGHAGYIYRSEVSLEGQVYSVVASNATITRKPSKEDLIWERRIARAMNRAALASGGSYIGFKDGVRDIKNASDPLRDIKNASDPLRDIKNASDPLRDIKNASDPLRDIKNASDPLRGLVHARQGGFAITSNVFDALDRKEGLLVLEKEKTTHVWQDHTIQELEDVIDNEVRNIERAVLADLEPVRPFYDFISYLVPTIPDVLSMLGAKKRKKKVTPEEKAQLMNELIDRSVVLMSLHKLYLIKLYKKSVGRPVLQEYVRQLVSHIYNLNAHFDNNKRLKTIDWSDKALVEEVIQKIRKNIEKLFSDVQVKLGIKERQYKWFGPFTEDASALEDGRPVLLDIPDNSTQKFLYAVHILVGMKLRYEIPYHWKVDDFDSLVEGVGADSKEIAEMKDIPEELFKKSWNEWILSDQNWLDMPHELKQVVLRWRAGSHDVLWASELADMLSSNDIKLVFLNSCKTSQGDTRSFEAAGVATTLMQAGIPAVVGMQLSISDQDALQFSSAFYKALADGDRLEEAVVKGRHSMATIKKGDGEHTTEIAQFWGVPTLYLRQEHVADTFQFRSSETS